jgi:shikimate dehydrogenase
VKITGETAVVGLIGWPVGHSVSPAMHNAAFARLELNWVYVPFPVPPERLGQAVAGLFALGVRGVNVTIPHKEAIRPFLARLSPEAEEVGAVNTLVRDTAGWVGHNTDGEGFLRALKEEAGVDPAGASFLILGAGGAAKAVAFAVARVGAAKVAVANRTVFRAEALCRALSSRWPCRVEALPLEEAELSRAVSGADILVNALPLGMHPRVEEMPPVPPEVLKPPLVVCDLVYNPRPTRWLAAATANGCRTMDGLPMLVAQGALALEMWTGVKVPVEVMRRAAEEAVSGAAYAGGGG